MCAPVKRADTSGGIWNVWDIRYWSCVMKKTFQCPDNDIRFYLYTKIDVSGSRVRKCPGVDAVKSLASELRADRGLEFNKASI
ncbi:hypothetical protein JTB14_026351 [Gonioctena quinquepunctata]|nr:hypothetical protein JTB14_026351 [Gonioctena quinquepunctata]